MSIKGHDFNKRLFRICTIMRISKKKIENIKKYFTDKPVLKAYSFGSYARNEPEKDSDVDLFKFITCKLELEQVLKKEVDLVSNNRLSPRLRPYMDKEKSLIYEK